MPFFRHTSHQLFRNLQRSKVHCKGSWRIFVIQWFLLPKSELSVHILNAGMVNTQWWSLTVSQAKVKWPSKKFILKAREDGVIVQLLKEKIKNVNLKVMQHYALTLKMENVLVGANVSIFTITDVCGNKFSISSYPEGGQFLVVPYGVPIWSLSFLNLHLWKVFWISIYWWFLLDFDPPKIFIPLADHL